MKQKVTSLVLVMLLLTSAAGYAQINNNRLLRMRDSLDYLLLVNPSSSAILVKKGELEIYSFNTLLSSSQFNDKQGNNSNLLGKQLLFNSLLQLNYGIARNRRFNVGLDVSYRAYRYDLDKNASVFSLFESNPQNVRSVTYAGPRVRIQPFRKIRNLTYQSYVWIPIAKDTRQGALGSTKINWGHTVFWYRYFNSKIGVFGQANFAFAFPGKNSAAGAKTEFYLPLSASVSFVATRKDIFFGSLSYSWTNEDIGNITEGADSDFSQYGLGYQRIISKRFFANISYNGTIFSRNTGKWSGVNLGVRYLY